jgi:tRNA A-37 threonylcarbamoyl transferase component Bud32
VSRSVDLTVDPGHREALASRGLVKLADFWNFSGDAPVKALVPGHSVVRFEARGGRYFLKRIEGAAAAEVAHEARVLGTLRAAGLPVAEVVAVGVEGSRGVLVTGALPVRGNLEHVLCRATPPPTPSQIRRHLRRLVDLVRRLHAAGVQHRDCYLVHVLVGAGDSLHLVDFGRARILGRLSLLARVKDLAGLDFSTPGRLASDTLRLALLRRYLGTRSRAWLRCVARLVRWKSARIRRHVERGIARAEPNLHVTR